jgi:hypothetical protein
VRAFGCFAAGYLAGVGELATIEVCRLPTKSWVWVDSVHDSQNIFAIVDGQRAFGANNSD